MFLRPSLVYESPGTLLKRQILIHSSWESAFLTILPNDAGPRITFWVESIPRYGTRWGTSNRRGEGDILCSLCLKKFIYIILKFYFELTDDCFIILVWFLSHININRSELRHWGSSLWHSGLSHPAACGILAPWPGTEPMSPALEGRFSTTRGVHSMPLHTPQHCFGISRMSVAASWGRQCRQETQQHLAHDG